MLNEIPFELLLYIFSFLDFEEKIKNVYMVNNKFNKAVLMSENIKITKIETMRFLKKLNPIVLRIEHRYICYPMLEIIIRKYTKLRSLSLRNSIPWYTDINLISNLTKLTKLDLSNLFIIRDMTIIMISKKCRSLVYLDISNNYQLTNLSLKFIADYLNKLRYLNISKNLNYDPLNIKNIKNKCKKLIVYIFT